MLFVAVFLPVVLCCCVMLSAVVWCLLLLVVVVAEPVALVLAVPFLRSAAGGIRTAKPHSIVIGSWQRRTALLT